MSQRVKCQQTHRKERGEGKKKPLKLYGNSKRDVYDSRPAGGWGGQAGSAIPAYFTFSGGFLIINNSCSGKKCQIAVIFTVELYIIFSKRSRWAWKWRDPIDPRFHWFPLFFSFFFSSQRQSKETGGAVAVRRSPSEWEWWSIGRPGEVLHEKQPLRIVLHSRRGGAVGGLQRCSWHVTAGDLPALNETPMIIKLPSPQCGRHVGCLKASPNPDLAADVRVWHGSVGVHAEAH